MKIALLGATLMALVPGAGSAQVVTPASGLVTSTPIAAVYPGTTDTRSVTDGWTGTIRNLQADSTAVGRGPNGGTVTVQITSQATWASSGLSGTVSLLNSVDYDAPKDFGLRSAKDFEQPDWSYVFSVDRDATLTFDYDVTASGSRSGLFALGAYIFGLTSDQVQSANLKGDPNDANPDPSGKGELVYQLTANRQYTMGLYNFSNESSGLPDVTTKGIKRGTFSFAIASAAGAVPEASSWALMLVGFGALGLTLRRNGARPARA